MNYRSWRTSDAFRDASTTRTSSSCPTLTTTMGSAAARTVARPASKSCQRCRRCRKRRSTITRGRRRKGSRSSCASAPSPPWGWSVSWKNYLFIKMGLPRPLFHLFSSFQTHITHFTNKQVCEIMSSSIWYRDSNFGTWVSSHNY